MEELKMKCSKHGNQKVVYTFNGPNFCKKCYEEKEINDKKEEKLMEEKKEELLDTVRDIRKELDAILSEVAFKLWCYGVTLILLLGVVIIIVRY